MYKPKGKNGGARPGAGRKRGGHNQTTLDQLHGRQLMIKLVLKNIFPIINAQIQKAVGECYRLEEFDVVKTKDGEVLSKTAIVYKQTPDTNAAKALLEYTFGKPKESIDLTVDNPGATSSIDNLSESIRKILETKLQVIPTQQVHTIKPEPVQTIAEVVPENINKVTIDPKAILENK